MDKPPDESARADALSSAGPRPNQHKNCNARPTCKPQLFGDVPGRGNVFHWSGDHLRDEHAFLLYVATGLECPDVREALAAFRYEIECRLQAFHPAVRRLALSLIAGDRGEVRRLTRAVPDEPSRNAIARRVLGGLAELSDLPASALRHRRTQSDSGLALPRRNAAADLEPEEADHA